MNNPFELISTNVFDCYKLSWIIPQKNKKDQSIKRYFRLEDIEDDDIFIPDIINYLTINDMEPGSMFVEI